MHSEDAFIIAACIFIGGKNIFGIIILYLKKAFVFSFCGAFILDLLRIPEKTQKKLKIIKANQYMVNESDFLICYVKNSWGGAAKTLEYAKQKKKNIYNLA